MRSLEAMMNKSRPGTLDIPARRENDLMMQARIKALIGALISSCVLLLGIFAAAVINYNTSAVLLLSVQALHNELDGVSERAVTAEEALTKARTAMEDGRRTVADLTAKTNALTAEINEILKRTHIYDKNVVFITGKPGETTYHRLDCPLLEGIEPDPHILNQLAPFGFTPCPICFGTNDETGDE